MTMQDKRICIGVIAQPHGVKGLAKILPYAQDLSLIEEAEGFEITLKNPLGKYVLAEIKGVTSREDVQRLQGTELFIARDKLPPAEDGEYYIEDLIGLKASDESGAEVGKVMAVHNFGAGDLLEIRPKSGGETFLIPFSDETVVEVSEIVKLQNFEQFLQ